MSGDSKPHSEFSRALDILREDHPGDEFCDKCWAVDTFESLVEQLEAFREAAGLLIPYADRAELRWMSVEDAKVEVPARAVAKAVRALRESNPAIVPPTQRDIERGEELIQQGLIPDASSPAKEPN